MGGITSLIGSNSCKHCEILVLDPLFLCGCCNLADRGVGFKASHYFTNEIDESGVGLMGAFQYIYGRPMTAITSAGLF